MISRKLVCGRGEAWLSAVRAGSVDCIVTDPPYGINFQSGFQGQDHRSGKTVSTGRDPFFSKMQNDSDTPTAWLGPAYRALKAGGAIYVFCHWTKWGELCAAATAAGFKVKNMLVLRKSNHGMGDLAGAYAPKHELLLFAAKGRHILRGARMPDVWDVPVKFSGARRLHPCEKPLPWMLPCISRSTDAGDLVVDPFCGSGSTLEAAHALGRRWAGVELDKEHYKTAYRRMLAVLRRAGQGT